MAIDEHLRAPAVQFAHTTAGFRVPEEDEVPVQIEQVVIRPSPRPLPAVQHGLIVDAGCRAAGLLQGLDESSPPIRIHQRIDEDDLVGEQLSDGRVGGGGQHVDGRQGGIGAGGLVAVNGVRHPGRGRQSLNDRLGLGRRRLA